MEKLWAGRTAGDVNRAADAFNSSISFDFRLWKEDAEGSAAHARMLARQGIISEEDCNAIVRGLEDILKDIETGRLAADPAAEDIHMFIEAELTRRIGDAGKRVHTARSRNDQVALDTRMYLRAAIDHLSRSLASLVGEIGAKADEHISAVMPGYTHLQHAQPVLFSHYILAYAFMFLRDMDRLSDCRRRLGVCPIGSCALAGTTYDTDRAFEASLLGFDRPCENSLDGVSDRDFAVEFLSAASICMMHLSRFSEELILWSSSEFGFVEMSDAYSTGSSIMPQKKNPDMAELCRGKTGRVYGDLVSLLTTLKGLPLAYNKDMQEDKEPLFDAVDTLEACLEVFTGMLRTLKVNERAMLRAARQGFMNATDLADYLARRGVPFRDAYKISGKAVAYCIECGKTLEDLTPEEFKIFSPLFDDDVYAAIDIASCATRRTSFGGSSPESVRKQLETIKERLA